MIRGEGSFTQEFWEVARVPWLMGIGVCAIVCPVALLADGDPFRRLLGAVTVGVMFGLGPAPFAAFLVAWHRWSCRRSKRRGT